MRLINILTASRQVVVVAPTRTRPSIFENARIAFTSAFTETLQPFRYFGFVFITVFRENDYGLAVYKDKTSGSNQSISARTYRTYLNRFPDDYESASQREKNIIAECLARRVAGEEAGLSVVEINAAEIEYLQAQVMSKVELVYATPNIGQIDPAFVVSALSFTMTVGPTVYYDADGNEIT